MEELSYNAKLAVVKVLNEILNADNVVHEKEVQYMNEVIHDFGLESKYEDDIKTLLTLQALATIRELNVEQKEMVAKMMGKMIVIDNEAYIKYLDDDESAMLEMDEDEDKDTLKG